MHMVQSGLRVLATFVASVTVGGVSLAAAADDHAHGVEKAGVLPTIEQGILPFVLSLAVFAVVFAIVAVAIWPKITRGLDDRANKIREEIESAELARRQAKDALEEYQKSLENARAEAQKMLDQTRSQQAQLAADLKAKADAELGQLRERAMKDIETARRAALAEIYSETANLATAVASKILRKEIRADDQRNLVEESVRALQAGKN
ncbi:MAG TPA: F0F1 ATP synthase subunit B [Phycisphaerales bacterium]|nr:F0F1 ATP synthase subunit B [Phycisphaerales bacterium]